MKGKKIETKGIPVTGLTLGAVPLEAEAAGLDCVRGALQHVHAQPR